MIINYSYFTFNRGLCDVCQSGKLNKEQFALSMWLIKQQLRGIEPPASLTPEMMPPSLRKLTENVVVSKKKNKVCKIYIYNNLNFLKLELMFCYTFSTFKSFPEYVKEYADYRDSS